ncbi:molybdenum cofactor biosynthesis moeA family protein [Mycobacteroides abscessus MAB_110811_2726]|nr:molybdenum cofactor biosynthesis moeA family protein [Mycobacteroides abscessus MAB_110811_2726]
MRSVEEQQAKVTAAAVAPRPVRVAIAEAQGLLCAEEVVTARPLPGFDQAAIDGYAVRSVDVQAAGGVVRVISPGEGGSPDDEDDIEESAGEIGTVELPVVGTVRVGERTPTRLQPRQAVRVQTGAPMPTLADAVLPLRWSEGASRASRCCARCVRVTTCGAPATTCSPVTSRCAQAPSSVPPR